MADERWEDLRKRLGELVSGYAGRIEYGNLRLEVYDANGDHQHGGRIAMAYETPGGSTNQFGVSYDDGEFRMLDASAEHEIRSSQPAEVASHMADLIRGIPDARASRLRQDIDQMLTDGSSRLQVLEELNRLLRLGTEFRGGSLTVDELTEARRYLVERTSADGE